jgi:signal transduction histidine kinase/DNA-binding LytR/AlgR family response regulator
MGNFVTASIRARLIVLVVSAIALAQLVILALSAWQEASRYALAKRDGMVSTAQIIAAASARATAEGDVAAAYQAIRAMGRIEGMVFAGLERMDGTSFADVGATEQLASDLVIERAEKAISVPMIFATRTLEVRVPVIYGGSTVGQMRLIADTRDLPGRVFTALAIEISGGLFALAVALLVVLRMQGAITAPLVALTRAMSGVSANHDYTVTLKAESRDEVGILVDGFNGMLTGIRERDARLAQHRARLEQDVAERTVDFQRAAAEASAANSAKSDFLATMSHEIRTPMNGILVMAELLAAAELPDRARRQAEVIARSGASLLAIINDILDLSKIEAGKLEVEHLAVDAGEAVDTVLKLFADRARSKGLDLAAQMALPRAVRVNADPTRLGQVLSNLVNNALKFTQKGGVCVHVTQEADRIRFAVTDTGIGIAADKLGSIFEAFSQADQTTTRQFGGTGLGLTIARRLVDAMGGELAVTSQAGQGATFHFSLPGALATGAGQWTRWTTGDAPRAVVALKGAQSRDAAAAQLAEAGFAVDCVGEDDLLTAAARGAMLVITGTERLHGLPRLSVAAEGGILVLARADEDIDTLLGGNRCDATLSWPLARADLDDIITRLIAGRPLAESAPQRTHTESPRFTGLRVLVADDAEVNREVADAALQRLGIRAEFVENGRQAVDAVMSRRFDLVLMDGSMPELDGFEATRMIRGWEGTQSRARTPIVALTAHVVGTAADAWRAAGMDGVLHKPFTLAQMASVIATHTGVAATTTQPPEQADTAITTLDTGVLNDLLAMAGGVSAVVDRITGLYRTQSQARIVELRAAMEAGDLDRLGKAAHALKSMSYNVGAREVAEDAADIERIARMEARGLTPDEINRLTTRHAQTLEALTQWRKNVA